jgi:putative membrane protein
MTPDLHRLALIATALPFGGAHLGEFLPPLIACCVYVALYIRRARTLARRGAGLGSWRIVSFMAGVTLVTAVQVGPFDSLADQILFVHMVQHIIIGDICSLLIVLGVSGPMIAPLLRLRLTRPIRVLTHPVLALVLWATDLYAWHLPLLYQLAIRHDLVHALEHACLLWFGLLLWAALIGPLPKPNWFTGWAKLWYVIGVRVFGAILANVFIWTQTVFYPVYRASDASRGLNPLSDQNVAGGVMMVEQVVLTACLLGWLFLRWIKQDAARQELLDFASSHRIELSDARAARAAASGSTERLRERLRGAAGPAPGAGPDAPPATPASSR